MLDSGAEGPGSNRRRDAVGNSLRQTVHTHCASFHQAAKLVAALLRVAKVTAGLAESNGSLHVTYRLSAKNRDQLQNPTLGNLVWATFTFFITKWNIYHRCITKDRNMLCHKMPLDRLQFLLTQLVDVPYINLRIRRNRTHKRTRDQTRQPFRRGR